MHSDLGFWSGGPEWTWRFLVESAGRTVTGVGKESLTRTLSIHTRTQEPRKPVVIPLSKMATVGDSLSPQLWSSALQMAFQLQPPVAVDRDALHVSNMQLLEAMELLFAEHDDRDMLVEVEWSIAQLFGPLMLSRMVHVIKNDRYTSGFLEQLCGQHVETVFGYALAQHDKELRSAEERERLYQMLGDIKEAAVQKAGGAAWIESAKLRAAIASHVNSTTTVVWGESRGGSSAANRDSVGDQEDHEWLIFWTFYANVPIDGSLYFERWHSALRYALEWQSPLKHVLLQRLRRLCSENLVQYDPAANAVVLSSASLSPPFFYGRAQNSVLYGGLGYLYARALASAVDYAPPLWSSRSAPPVRSGLVLRRFRRNARFLAELGTLNGSHIRKPKATAHVTTEAVLNGLLPARRANVEDGTPWSTTPALSSTTLLKRTSRVGTAKPVTPFRPQLSAAVAGDAETIASTTKLASRNRTRADVCKSPVPPAAWTSLRRIRRGAGLYATSRPSAQFLTVSSRRDARTPIFGDAHAIPEHSGQLSGPNARNAASASVPAFSLASTLQRYGPCSGSKASFLDAAALDIAHDAFAKLLNRGEDVRLTDLPEFTTEQLFFLTACHTRCERVLRPERSVCNDAAVSGGAFAAAFSCATGTFMNPADRCPSRLRVKRPVANKDDLRRRARERIERRRIRSTTLKNEDRETEEEEPSNHRPPSPNRPPGSLPKRRRIEAPELDFLGAKRQAALLRVLQVDRDVRRRLRAARSADGLNVAQHIFWYRRGHLAQRPSPFHSRRSLAHRKTSNTVIVDGAQDVYPAAAPYDRRHICRFHLDRPASPETPPRWGWILFMVLLHPWRPGMTTWVVPLEGLFLDQASA
ncbi:hypothetical protein HPB50_000521 [Hyalomma asiaticum]|uniref:Uncharacterized protein n=1 Tax=Hyalomma asiaticum TaxID=266040 RepID=A0ACB7T0W1_HYAAI|nr:hypothetical protein HPB50_000521 [Hyalomma asiaticum]